MTYCGERTVVKGNAEKVEATTLRCRAWTCPDCAPKRAAQLIATAHRGKANTFITLTVKRGKYGHPALAAQALAHAWRIIVKRAVREANRDVSRNPYPFGANDGEHWDLDGKSHWPRQVRLPPEGLQYLCVIEAHKSGWPHLHILARSAWIGQDWLAEQTKDLLDAHKVDVQRIWRRSQVNAYVAKYCSKCTAKFGTTKRYWMSARYELSTYEKKKTDGVRWHDIGISNQHLVQIVHNWESMGWHVIRPNWWHAETTRGPPPEAEVGAASPPPRRAAHAGLLPQASW